MAVSHYQVLGVGATASADDIRAAFRRRAREVHPDRRPAPASGAAAGGNGTSYRPEQAMQELNEAWRVLGDPGRRRAYDRSLGTGPDVHFRARPPGVDPDDLPYFHEPAEPGDIGVIVARALPWVVALAVLVGIFVFTAFAGGTDDDRVSGSDLVGKCVRLERGGVVSSVACEEPNDGRVDLVAARASLCPEESSAVRLASQVSWLCLRDASASLGQ
ncbi:MAG: J domain-containing protein [Actinomycetota bacterium]|nr:J domain-containing protein [Actinomycetota bacterium]